MIAARLIAAAAGLLLSHSAVPAQPLAGSPDDHARIALIERARPSVVQVRATRKPAVSSADDRALDDLRGMFGLPPGRPQEGSGFIVDQARGLVVTAAHIVDGADEVAVIDSAGNRMPAAIVLEEPARGIAVLRMTRLAAPALPLVERLPPAGEGLLLLGWMSPVRSLLALQAMAMGTVTIDAASAGKAVTGPYVALDRPLPLGSFGGAPVLDSTGRAVGLVTATYGRDSGQTAVTLMLPLAGLSALIERAAANEVPRR